MPKIRVTCTDPYATDCSSDDEESIEQNKPKIGGLFVKEISVLLPIIIPTISTIHFDSLAKLKSDLSFRIDKTESPGHRHNCIVLALAARKSEDIPKGNSVTYLIQNRLERLSMAQICQFDATNSSSMEDRSAEATPNSINRTVDIPVARISSRPVGLKHPPGLRLTSSGKWGVQIRNPFKRAQVWLGSYSTVEEASNMYNKKKAEYASLMSELCKEDASFRADKSKPSLATSTDASARVVESKPSMEEPNCCVILALSAKEPKDTPRTKSAENCQFEITSSSLKNDEFALASPSSVDVAVDIPVSEKSEDNQKRKSVTDSIQNRLENLSMAQICQFDATNSSSMEDRSAEATPNSINRTADTPVARNSSSPVGLKYPPGLRLTSSGKWGVQIRNPFKRAQVWLGSYSTVEEASNIYNKKKAEYASLMSELCEEDASFRVPILATSTDASARAVESKPSMDEPNCCVILALSANEPKDTPRKKSARKCQLEITSSSLKNDAFALASPNSVDVAVDIPVFKKSRSLGAKGHPGLMLTASGKYAVRIRDPITRSRIWLGTYSTIEEAKSVYNKKTLEYTLMRPTVIKRKKHSKGKGKRKQRKLVMEGISVRETLSGKQCVSIRDPVPKHGVWLGSHATPEEAVKPYNKMMFEFNSTYDRGSVDKCSSNVLGLAGKEAVNGACIPADDVADMCVPAHDVDSLAATNIIDTECPVIKLTDAGKWKVAIRHPMLKHSLSLGSYDTAEKAEQVYNSSKLELDAMLHSDKIACPTVAVAGAVHVNKYKGVKASGRGRWSSQIQNPFNKKQKIYLGTYKTAESAAEVFNRTRREFDAIVSLVKKRKFPEAHMTDSKFKKAVILEEAGTPIGERTRLFEIVVEPHSYSENSAITIASSQVSIDNSNDMQIVDVSPTEQGIIDIYGQLVGEYSRLDDELWLSRPGEDDFDVNGAYFYGNLDHGWDPSLKSSMKWKEEKKGLD